MRVFSGRGGAVYAAGTPVAFTGLPLADCGDGFTWRSADESLRCWADGDFSFEAFEHGEWRSVGALEVRQAAATVSFGRCLSRLPVRASGVGLPTALVASEAAWTLEQAMAEGVAFDGPRFALGTASATLTGAREEGWLPLAQVRRVLAVLPSAASGAFVGLGELARTASGLTVTFDQGVSYA